MIVLLVILMMLQEAIPQLLDTIIQYPDQMPQLSALDPKPPQPTQPLSVAQSSQEEEPELQLLDI